MNRQSKRKISTNKLNRKRKQSSNKKNNNRFKQPPAAIVEYLKYIPINSKGAANKFYKRIDKEWADDANKVNIIIMDKKNIDNLQDIIDASKNATQSCIREKGDCEDTAKAVIDLIQNPEFRENLGSKGYEFLNNELSWSTISKKTLKVYKNAAQNEVF